MTDLVRCPRCQTRVNPIALDGPTGLCIGCDTVDMKAAIRRAEMRRDAGMAKASAAHPDDRARVDAAIRQLVQRGTEFDANDVRVLTGGVKGGVVGAAFNAARSAGLIRPIGMVASTAESTHAHRIARWLPVAS